MRQVIVAVTLIISFLSIGLGTPAHADKVCHTETETYTDANGNIVTVVKEVCVDDGNPGDGGNGDSGCSVEGGRQIPCKKLGYTWFDSEYCYAGDVTEMYPAEQFTEYWQGHTDGSLWMCAGMGPDMVDAGSPFFFWVPPGGVPGVDPAVLAQQALDNMRLATPNIHMAPQPPLMTYVGLETWLWMDPGQWDELTMTVSAGATSVTVVAKPVEATWGLTAGSTMCSSAGRAWVKGMSSGEQTDCSYTFNQVSDGQPDGEFPVTSTLTYQVDWTCSGACPVGSGSLGQVDGPMSSSAIRVGERQSVVIH